jgi:hypothetical protein
VGRVVTVGAQNICIVRWPSAVGLNGRYIDPQYSIDILNHSDVIGDSAFLEEVPNPLNTDEIFFLKNSQRSVTSAQTRDAGKRPRLPQQFVNHPRT